LRRADFDRVYRQGKRHFGTHMTVFYLSNDKACGPRVGFTVGRVLGGAVQRNRIKRRLREAARVSLRELQAPVDVVINPRKSALAAEFSELRAEVESAFRTLRTKIKSASARSDGGEPI
jgi:ribonuclease P protein component